MSALLPCSLHTATEMVTAFLGSHLTPQERGSVTSKSITVLSTCVKCKWLDGGWLALLPNLGEGRPSQQHESEGLQFPNMTTTHRIPHALLSVDTTTPSRGGADGAHVPTF